MLSMKDWDGQSNAAVVQLCLKQSEAISCYRPVAHRSIWRMSSMRNIYLVAFSAVLLGSAALAQAPLSEIDTHVAAAKAAAGQDFRGTFMNLCLPSAPR